MKTVTRESYFTHVDCVILSPDQDKLLISTNLGKKFHSDFRGGVLSRNSQPSSVSSPDSTRIFHYSEYRGHYALGTKDGIKLCKWSEIISGNCTSIEQGCSIYSTDWIGSKVIAGGDNGKLIEIDPIKCSAVKTYVAHSGSVNAVRRRNDNTFISAGFDGVCRLWDRRTGDIEQKFAPSSWGPCARKSANSAYIKCLDVMEDWVVCGGGPNLSLWYLKEDSGVSLLDMGDVVPSVVRFLGDSVVAGGNSPYLYHWGLSGKLKYKVLSKLERVEDISINTKLREQPMLVAAGTPCELNVFSDLGYLSHTVPFM